MTQPARTVEGALERLTLALPSPGALHGDDVGEQARAVLRFIVSRAEDGQREVVAPDPATCPNCGAPTDSTKTPYCCAQCREVSAFVRQFRNALAEGTVFDPERQVALGQKFWHLAGGGYPLRRSIAPPSSLKQVLKRTAGLCESCGAPATTFDHTGSG